MSDVLDSWPSERISALAAVLISSALALFGSSMSFWLAHGGSPLGVLLYWPAIPVLLLLGEGGVLGGAPDWLFNGSVFVSLFAAYFGIVHWARYTARRLNRGV